MDFNQFEETLCSIAVYRFLALLRLKSNNIDSNLVMVYLQSYLLSSNCPTTRDFSPTISQPPRDSNEAQQHEAAQTHRSLLLKSLIQTVRTSTRIEDSVRR
jgi:hypothetical protein